MAMSSAETGMRILVVDDHAEMGDMIVEWLTERGFLATAVQNGRDALSALGREGFDAMVTDVRMPEMDGLQLMSAARAAHPGLAVIVMTAYGAIDSAVEATANGAHAHLTKPFKFEELARLLRELRALARS
jgi:two-component system response regulator HydG